MRKTGRWHPGTPGRQRGAIPLPPEEGKVEVSILARLQRWGYVEVPILQPLPGRIRDGSGAPATIGRAARLRRDPRLRMRRGPADGLDHANRRTDPDPRPWRGGHPGG